MKITLQKIQAAVPALNALMVEKLPVSASFVILALTKEINGELKTLHEACSGKELEKEEYEQLMATEVEITNFIPKSILTCEISPIHLLLIEDFIKD